MRISELRTHLGQAIQEVQKGETIEVTRYGEVIAFLVPPAAKPNQTRYAPHLLV